MVSARKVPTPAPASLLCAEPTPTAEELSVIVPHDEVGKRDNRRRGISAP